MFGPEPWAVCTSTRLFLDGLLGRWTRLLGTYCSRRRRGQMAESRRPHRVRLTTAESTVGTDVPELQERLSESENSEWPFSQVTLWWWPLKWLPTSGKRRLG